MCAVSTSKPAYHHGDLKTALLDAADALLDEGGPNAVSLREAARRAGVSAMAPYRHFADKDTLLAALATRGFAAFGRAMQEAAAGAPDPLAALGPAYVRFALERPGRFRLMFGSGLVRGGQHIELGQAARRTFDILVAAVRRRRPEGDAELGAMRAWSLVHGLSQLLLDGMLPELDADRIAQIVTGVPDGARPLV